MSKSEVLSITLYRDGNSVPLGFRLRGGSDLKEPLVIQRVSAGSPSHDELRPGDVIVKINGRSAAQLSHQKAHDLIKTGGSPMALVINREVQQENTTPAGPQVTAVPHQVSTVSGEAPPRNISNIMASPLANLPVTVFPGGDLARQQQMFAAHAGDRERIVVTNQPYRTTPLVLPGAKVGRDNAATTQCYLALQSNPLLWSSTTVAPATVGTHQAATNALLKQKLEAASAVVQRNLALSAAAEGRPQPQQQADPAPKQEVVHKQFNSPIGLYSKENVEQVLALQSGLIPPNPKAQPPLDLANSETLKALMEEDVQKHSGMKEYRPAPVKVSPVNPAFKVNTLGKSHENIQQSYSFKRLMADVLGETDF